MDPDRNMTDSSNNEREIIPSAKESEKLKEEPVSSSTEDIFAGALGRGEATMVIERSPVVLERSCLVMEEYNQAMDGYNQSVNNDTGHLPTMEAANLATQGVGNQLKVEGCSSMFDASPLQATDRAVEHSVSDISTYESVEVKKEVINMLPSIDTLFNRNHQGKKTDTRFYPVEDTTRSYQMDNTGSYQMGSTPVTASRSIRVDATSEVFYLSDNDDLAVVPPLIIDDQDNVDVSSSFHTLTVSNPGQEQYQTPRNSSSMTPAYSSELTPGFRYEMTPGGYAYEERSSAYQRSSMTPLPPYNMTPLHSSDMTPGPQHHHSFDHTPGPTTAEMTPAHSTYNMTPLHTATSFHDNSMFQTPISYHQKYSGDQTPLEFRHKYSGEQTPLDFQHKYTGVVLPPQSYTASGIYDYDDEESSRGSGLVSYQQQQFYNNSNIRTGDQQRSLTEDTDGAIKVVSQTNFNQDDITAPSSCGSITAPDTPLGDITNKQAIATKAKESKPEITEQGDTAKEPEKCKKTDQSQSKKTGYNWPIPVEHTCCWCWKEFMDLDEFLAHLDSHTKKNSVEKGEKEKNSQENKKKKEKKETKKREKKEKKKSKKNHS